MFPTKIVTKADIIDDTVLYTMDVFSEDGVSVMGDGYGECRICHWADIVFYNTKEYMDCDVARINRMLHESAYEIIKSLEQRVCELESKL